MTIHRIEAGEQFGKVTDAAATGIRAALEQAGIGFVPGGVRRRRSAAERAALLEELRAVGRDGAARTRSRLLLTDDDLSTRSVCRSDRGRHVGADPYLVADVSLLAASIVLAGRDGNEADWTGLDRLIASPLFEGTGFARTDITPAPPAG